MYCFYFLKLEKPVTVELQTIARVEPPTKVMQPDESNDITTVRSLLRMFYGRRTNSLMQLISFSSLFLTEALAAGQSVIKKII